MDAAQAELEAGNAALLQGAPFLVELLALQAAAPGMQPVRPTPRLPHTPPFQALGTQLCGTNGSPLP